MSNLNSKRVLFYGCQLVENNFGSNVIVVDVLTGLPRDYPDYYELTSVHVTQICIQFSILPAFAMKCHKDKP